MIPENNIHVLVRSFLLQGVAIVILKETLQIAYIPHS